MQCIIIQEFWSEVGIPTLEIFSTSFYKASKIKLYFLPNSIYRQEQLFIFRRYWVCTLLVKWEPVSHFGYTQRVQCINIDIFPYKIGEPELSVCRKETRETVNSFPVSHPLNPLHRAATLENKSWNLFRKTLRNGGTQCSRENLSENCHNFSLFEECKNNVYEIHIKLNTVSPPPPQMVYSKNTAD